MKKFSTLMLIATSMVAASCSNDTLEDGNNEVIDESLKTKISFSMTDEEGTLERPASRAGFGNATEIAMRIRSKNGSADEYKYYLGYATANAAGTKDYSEVNFQSGSTPYWDDAFGRLAYLSVFAIAIPDQASGTNADGQTVEGHLDGTVNTWTDASSNTLTWDVKQTQTDIKHGDLTYSNNIQPTDATVNGHDGRYIYDFSTSKYPDYSTNLGDGCMQFKLQDNDVTDGPGKFDKGHLIFEHALSRVTIAIKVGDGFTFTTTLNTFKFTKSGENVKLVKFPSTGTFNVETGAWSAVTNAGVNSMVCKPAESFPISGDGKGTELYSLQAHVLPGFAFTQNQTSAAFEFTIDNNTYYVSSDDLFKALKSKAGSGADQNGLATDATSYTMEKGKNYKFTITVGKTKIEHITATLIPWADVEGAEQTPSNGRVEFSSKLFSGDGVTTQTATTEFKLYRALDDAGTIKDDYEGKNWKTGYNTDGAATLSYADNKYSTNWYWDSNKSYYHLRTYYNVYNTGTDNSVPTTEGSTGDYFTMTSGATASTDYQWGATFKNVTDLKLTYDIDKGFANQLTPAIGPLKNDQQINITQQHMMSNIKVVLTTSDGNDAVQLYDSESSKGATVTLTNFYKEAKVLMGTGLVTPITEGAEAMKASQNMTTPSTYFADGVVKTNAFTWSVVPQLVDRGSGDSRYIGLTITTPDNNMYYVVADLSLIHANAITSSHKADPYNGGAITRWYPGYEYTYTIKLTKTGVKVITASIVEWVPVTAAQKDITLEN